jgi:hypothetical protein
MLHVPFWRDESFDINEPAPEPDLWLEDTDPTDGEPASWLPPQRQPIWETWTL